MPFHFKDIKLPQKIAPCPIEEAIIEFRFDSPFPPDAIFGIIFNQFKVDYPKAEPLPILQLPEVVRGQDPNLRFKPYYKLSKDESFLFQVGARTFSLISLKPYCGWDVFSAKIQDVLTRVEKIQIVGNYLRLGIRYINRFDFNILKTIDLTLMMGKDTLVELETNILLQIPSQLNGFRNTLRIANNAKIKKQDTEVIASIIDIDTHIENPSKEKIVSLIDAGHLEEKKLFFSLLKEDFLEKELNPVY